MDMKLKDKFSRLWRKYFNDASLPITFYYIDEEGRAELMKPTSGHRCIIGDLIKVREGNPISYNAEAIGCFGGKRYLGFSRTIAPNFEYFLSCGIPGKLQGERYKKSPELVKEIMKQQAAFSAPARFIVFKRWDMLEEADSPEVVVFFARPDVLAGLFTLANYDQAEPNGVFAPFSAGCGSIVQYPYLEAKSKRPRGVIGMFDVSARPFVPEDMLTFSAPINKFKQMVENMEESFLITGSWQKLQKRIGSKAK
jgi:uncharacterized protein (DUF169 family)